MFDNKLFVVKNNKQQVCPWNDFLYNEIILLIYVKIRQNCLTSSRKIFMANKSLMTTLKRAVKTKLTCVRFRNDQRRLSIDLEHIPPWGVSVTIQQLGGYFNTSIGLVQQTTIAPNQVLRQIPPGPRNWSGLIVEGWVCRRLPILSCAPLRLPPSWIFQE